MSSEDYLTRQFQQLGKVLAALMGLREKKKYNEAIQGIDQVLDTWFHIHEEQIDNLSDEDFLELVFSNKSHCLEKEQSIAELIYQKTLIFKETGRQAESQAHAKKALLLFKAIDSQNSTFSIEIQQKIACLDQVLANNKNN